MLQEKRLISVAETQHCLGLSRSKIYELLSSGDLPSVKIGRRRLIPAVAIDTWVSGLDKPTSNAEGTNR